MPSTQTRPSTDVLIDTALAATGGGTLVTLETDAARTEALVLRDGALLRVTLDAALGTAVVAPAALVSPSRGRPSPRCVPAPH